MTDAVGLPLVEELSDDELRRFLSFLPARALEELRAGPWPEPHCGVCRALENLTSSGPAGHLLDYHDTPFRRHLETTHRVEGREVYARCCRIYRAAGWQGEPEPWGTLFTAKGEV